MCLAEKRRYQTAYEIREGHHCRVSVAAMMPGQMTQNRLWVERGVRNVSFAATSLASVNDPECQLLSASDIPGEFVGRAIGKRFPQMV